MKIRRGVDRDLIIARHAHVQQSRAHIIIVQIGIVEDAIAVLQMAHATVEAGGLNVAEHPVEQLDLMRCERQVLFRVRVAHAEMREDAGDFYMPQ